MRGQAREAQGEDILRTRRLGIGSKGYSFNHESSISPDGATNDFSRLYQRDTQNPSPQSTPTGRIRKEKYYFVMRKTA
ncbi:MAG TPA: hypothetical protein PLC76_01300 [Saprospiraceae bacterium]|nr:MAG: hypothetical protein HWD63_15975 [Candidatus Parvibacillus calidus]HRP83330.1 hypothetical protein [Saprospiraceae bacterium]